MMTTEELSKIAFRMTEHISLDSEHISVYESKDFPVKITASVHTPYKDGAPNGKAITRYIVGGKVCKTKRGLLIEINRLITENKEIRQ